MKYSTRASTPCSWRLYYPRIQTCSCCRLKFLIVEIIRTIADNWGENLRMSFSLFSLDELQLALGQYKVFEILKTKEQIVVYGWLMRILKMINYEELGRFRWRIHQQSESCHFSIIVLNRLISIWFSRVQYRLSFHVKKIDNITYLSKRSITVETWSSSIEKISKMFRSIFLEIGERSDHQQYDAI